MGEHTEGESAPTIESESEEAAGEGYRLAGHLERQVAVIARCHPRSVARVTRGDPTMATTYAAVTAALSQLGLPGAPSHRRGRAR